MERYYFNNKGNVLIGIAIVFIAVSLVIGSLYYYLSKQIPEVPEITKKTTADEGIIPANIIPQNILPLKEDFLPTEYQMIDVVNDTILAPFPLSRFSIPSDDPNVLTWE